MKVQGEDLMPDSMPLVHGGSGSSNGTGLIKAVSIREPAPLINTAVSHLDKKGPPYVNLPIGGPQVTPLRLLNPHHFE